MLRKLTEFAECTGMSKVYGDKYLRTPKSGYTAHPYSVVWIHILYTSTQVRIGPDKIFF